MKKTGVCPKCGGQDIVAMQSSLMISSDPRLRVTKTYFLSHQDFLPVTQYLCCTCGYLERWVDQEEFVKRGGKNFWTEQEDDDACWRGKLREKREKEAQEEHAEEKQKKNRRDDPWT